MRFLTFFTNSLNHTATFIRSYLAIGLVLFVCAMIVFSFSKASQKSDFEQSYAEVFRELGLSPVFPPREEFQTGDVFYFVYDESNPDDLSKTERTWLGTLKIVQTLANEYLDSRMIFPLRGQKDDTPARSEPNSNNSLLAIQSGYSVPAWDTLHIATFPTVSWNVSAGGALGSRGLLETFGMALGRSETAHLDFGDTRAFGLPSGSLAMASRYESEFTEKICPRLHLASGGNFSCEEGKVCQVVIVTRTYLSRSITVRSSSAARAQAGIDSVQDGIETKGNITLEMPSITIETGSDTDSDALQKLIEGVSRAVENSKQSNGSNSLGLVGSQGNIFSIEREFERPVAVAYDGLSGPIDQFSEILCGFDRRFFAPEMNSSDEPEFVIEPELQEEN